MYTKSKISKLYSNVSLFPNQPLLQYIYTRNILNEIYITKTWSRLLCHERFIFYSETYCIWTHFFFPSLSLFSLFFFLFFFLETVEYVYTSRTIRRILINLLKLKAQKHEVRRFLADRFSTYVKS